MYKRMLPRIILFLLAATLAGCAQLKVVQNPAAPARQAMQAGRYNEAAQRYLQLAGKAQSSQQQHYLVMAAVAAHQAGENQLAQHTLSRLFPSLLKPNDRIRANLVQADLYLARNRPAAALKHLSLPGPGVSANLADQLLKLRGQTLFKLNRPLAAVEALVQRGSRLSGQQARNNNTLIWQGLQSSNLPQANASGLIQANATVRGWIALARIERQSWGSSQALRQALQQWQNRYPQHPALANVAPRIVSQYKQRHKYPQRIALLLPLNGPLQAPAQAVRDGFLAGRFLSGSKSAPAIRIYDTGSTAKSAVQAYKKAIQGGAKIVIGPLTKKAVTAVAGVAQQSVPELALNYLGKNADSQVPADFYRMGLSPDDDAREVAGLASQAGLHRALTMAPDNSWGRDVVKAFKKSLRAQGGVVVDSAYFQPGISDFSSVIKSMLSLNASKSRYKALVSTLHRKIQYQAEPRDDVDFIFLAAQPREARLIRPQLKFFRASNIPVYATSSVYPGTPNPSADQDEDSITFCDTPWTLSNSSRITKPRNKLQQLWPQAFSNYSRLFALGLDAYRLIPPANAHALAPGKHFQGYTGGLYNNGNGRILRDLKCARFKNGKAVLLNQPENQAKQ